MNNLHDLTWHGIWHSKGIVREMALHLVKILFIIEVLGDYLRIWVVSNQNIIHTTGIRSRLNIGREILFSSNQVLAPKKYKRYKKNWDPEQDIFYFFLSHQISCWQKISHLKSNLSGADMKWSRSIQKKNKNTLRWYIFSCIIQ